MNPTTMMLRWYRRQTTSGANRQQPEFSPEEVLQLLRPDDDDHQPSGQSQASHRSDATDAADAARGAAVHEVAAQPSAWLGRLTKQQRREIGELADRLPMLLFHHSRGGHTSELLQRFGGWSTWRYDRALEVAASCIAVALNRGRLVA